MLGFILNYKDKATVLESKKVKLKKINYDNFYS